MLIQMCYKNISPGAARFVGSVGKVTGMPVRLAEGGSSKSESKKARFN